MFVPEYRFIKTKSVLKIECMGEKLLVFLKSFTTFYMFVALLPTEDGCSDLPT